MKKLIAGGLFVLIPFLMTACTSVKRDDTHITQEEVVEKKEMESQINTETMYTTDTKIADVINDLAFGDYARLIFPVETSYYSGDTLGNLKLTWYNNIDANKTVEIVNYMKSEVMQGNTIFYDIYSEEEKAKDLAKKDTGLFFFKGNSKEKFAVCNAGGAFAYVGAMQDSFPHALELSKRGYNAFALIYRPGRRLLVKTWQEQLHLSLTMQKN